MEVVNAHDSWTVLAAGNEGTIIAAVGWVPLRSRGLIQELWLSQRSVLEVLCDNQLFRYYLSTYVSRIGNSPGRQLCEYKPSGLQPQFLQFTHLSSRSVIFCYSHCACSDSQYIIQHMHCVIHHLWHITTSYREELNIQGVPGGMCQTSGGCSLC